MIIFTATTRATTTARSAALSAATSTVVVAHEAATDNDARQVDDVDAEFFALIYSDPELLRDEFEELVAAAWSRRPPPRGAPGRAFGQPPGRPKVARPFDGGSRPAGPVGRARDRGGRTRSPPKITTQIVVTRPVTTEEESQPRLSLLGWLAPPYPSAHSSA